MKIIKTMSLFLLLGTMTNCGFQDNEKALVIPAHSHNDYRNTRPLLDALAVRFKSIEADVFSIGDSLFVAHDSNQITQGRTLRTLYLDPLKEIISKKGGSVYGEGTEIILLVDIKDDGLRTYKLLHQILESYKEMITSYNQNIKNPEPIAVIVTGNRPFEYMQNQELRYAGYDGRISEMDSGIASSLMPLVSDNWQHYFKWNGVGEISIAEKDKLLSLVQKAHKNGYMLRFWATPDGSDIERNAVWIKLINTGVDLIGSDDLKGLQTLFLKQ